MYRKSPVDSAVAWPNVITALIAPRPSAAVLADARFAMQSPSFSYSCGLADFPLYTEIETSISPLPRFLHTKCVHLNTDGGFLCS